MHEVRHQLPGGWTVTYEVDDDDAGDRVIAGVIVRPAEPGKVPAGGMTARKFRQIPFGRVVARTWAEITNSGATYADLTASGATYADLTHTVQPDHAPRRGREHDEQFLLLVAQTWDRVIRQTTEPNLYDALVAELGRKGYKYKRGGARELVRKARRKGLLQDPPAPRAHAGGLTAKARQLLQG